VATITLSPVVGWQRELLATDFDQRMRRERLGDRIGKAVAVHRQRAAGRHLVGIGGAHDQRIQTAHFGVKQADRVGRGVVGPERVGTDQLGQSLGAVCGGGALRPHLVEHGRHATLRDLPRRLRAGEAAADHMDGLQARRCHSEYLGRLPQGGNGSAARREMRRWMRQTGAAAALGILSAVASPAVASEPPGASWFRKLSVAPPTADTVVVCHGFGCYARTPIRLSETDRATLVGLIRGATPQAERAGVGRAVAWFDRRIGGETGTTRARAYARGLAGDRSQFDCFDRTVNTTALLIVAQRLGALRHHAVSEPESRTFVPFLGRPHTTAVIEERKGGRKWAIDPWPHGHAQRPDILRLEAWHARD
jgi:hypothetical protein